LPWSNVAKSRQLTFVKKKDLTPSPPIKDGKIATIKYRKVQDI
jgi:hypothetical protein